MRLKRWMGLGLAFVLGGTATVHAQNLGVNPPPSIQPIPEVVAPAPPADGMTPAPYPFLPAPEGEVVQEGGDGGEAKEEKLGPVMPDKGIILMQTRLGDWLREHDMKVFGWIEGGITYSTNGPGVIPVEPRPNRFGDEFMVNQAYIAIEKATKKDELSFGWRLDVYGGADPVLIDPLGEFVLDPNSRFGQEFRQVYVSAHLPILSDGGVDMKIGKQNAIIGYEPFAAPYRPLYSNDYQWQYSQDRQFTGILATWHANPQLEITNAITEGWATFFTFRSGAPTYDGQIKYWLDEHKDTMVAFTILTGPEQLRKFSTTHMRTVVELQIVHNWNKHFTQVLQSDDGFEDNALNPSNVDVGNSQWYSAMNIFIYHVNCQLDLINREEWFDDVQGARTGFATAYEEVTLGFDYHPTDWFSVRPEVRYDYSNDTPVWNNKTRQNEFTTAVDFIVKF